MTDIFFECPDCQGLVKGSKMHVKQSGDTFHIKLVCKKGHEIEWNA